MIVYEIKSNLRCEIFIKFTFLYNIIVTWSEVMSLYPLSMLIGGKDNVHVLIFSIKTQVKDRVMVVRLTLVELCVRLVVAFSFIGGRNVRIRKHLSTIRMY